MTERPLAPSEPLIVPSTHSAQRTLTTVLLVSLYRTPASLEAAWKYFILCGVGIAQALFGTILLYFAAEGAKERKTRDRCPRYTTCWDELLTIS